MCKVAMFYKALYLYLLQLRNKCRGILRLEIEVAYFIRQDSEKFKYFNSHY